MALKDTIYVRRILGLTKDEFATLKRTPEYLLMLRQQMACCTSSTTPSQSDLFQLRKNVNKWLSNNCSDLYHIQTLVGDSQTYVHFLSETDMVNFKIFWAGYPYDSENPPPTTG